MEVIQAIFIRQTETRKQPKPHTVYRIEVHAAVRNWFVWRRYSEFDKLNSQFLTLFPKHPPPVPLPKKSIFPSTFSRPDKIEERRRGLENYLRGILSSRDDRWRQTDVWKAFLAIPIGRPLDATTFYTSETWLDEFNEMSNTAREIRSYIARRSTFVAQNEISAAHNCTLQAKKLLTLLSTRLSSLETGLTSLAEGGGGGDAMGEPALLDGEVRRRQDRLNSLKNEREMLNQLVQTTRQEQSLLSPSTHRIVTEPGERKQLLEKRRPSSRRAFGAAAAAAAQQQKEELERETRGLDNEGLVGYQQQVMQDQDQQVEQFSAILARQRQLGLAIGDELETQNQILDELESDVNRTGTKLKFAKKKLGSIK